MSKVRVYEVAKQLNMDQKTLVALFQSMGIGDVRNHMSAVETDVVERVKRHLERQRSPEVVEERVRADGRVVKRRSRAAEAEPESSVRAAPPSDVAAVRVPIPPASSSQTGERPAASDVAPASPVRRRAPAGRDMDFEAPAIPAPPPSAARAIPEAPRSAPHSAGLPAPSEAASTMRAEAPE